MVAKLWTSRGSTSTGPPADTDQMIHAAPSEVTYKIYIRSQPRRSVHQVQDQHRTLHRRTGTGPLLHHPPLHLPRSPPSDPQPYTDELVQITGLQASTGSQPLHYDDVYIYICIYIYIYDCMWGSATSTFQPATLHRRTGTGHGPSGFSHRLGMIIYVFRFVFYLIVYRCLYM